MYHCFGADLECGHDPSYVCWKYQCSMQEMVHVHMRWWENPISKLLTYISSKYLRIWGASQNVGTTNHRFIDCRSTQNIESTERPDLNATIKTNTQLGHNHSLVETSECRVDQSLLGAIQVSIVSLNLIPQCFYISMSDSQNLLREESMSASWSLVVLQGSWKFNVWGSFE